MKLLTTTLIITLASAATLPLISTNSTTIINGFQISNLINDDGDELLLFEDLTKDNVFANSSLKSDSTLSIRQSSTSPISQTTYNHLVRQSKLANIAYCSGPPSLIAPFTCSYQCKEFPNMNLVSTWGEDPLSPSVSVAGYLSVDHTEKTIVVGFRGSQTFKNWIVNFMVLRNPVENSYQGCEGCTVHQGFYNAYKDTKKEYDTELIKLVEENPGYIVNVVGHSLGGSVALLAATDFKNRGYKTSLTTFGQPVTGNTAFANYIDNLWLTNDTKNTTRSYYRVTHKGDVVPRVPFWHGYSPTAGEVYIGAAELNPPVSSLLDCEGQENEQCIQGNSLLSLVNLTAHNLYFVYLGGECEVTSL
uniref:triacylglycerol lipase n=1 Tax=Yarrowia galli TaxID=197054 RepID=A0A078BMQ0_9ASCO|nr:lipase [Yarrowia galli]